MSRLALTSLRPLSASFPHAGPSSRPFSTSPVAPIRIRGPTPPKKPQQFDRSVVSRKRIFHERKNKIKKAKEVNQIFPDYVLGHVFSQPFGGPKGYHGQMAPPADNLWDRSRLKKCLIHARQIYNWPVPKYEEGQSPRELLPGLNDKDKDLLFGALPNTTLSLKYDADAPEQVREARAEKVKTAQEKQGEMVARILDLRNANKKAIHHFNRRRILEEFGGGWNAGDVVVQCAFATMEIRSLNEHCIVNPHDTKNRMKLKQMVFDRASNLKYVKSKYPDRYDQALKDLGLDPRCVEGQLVFRT